MGSLSVGADEPKKAARALNIGKNDVAQLVICATFPL